MDKPTRRVRGNSEPPDDDLPISYWHDDAADARDDDRVQREIEEVIGLFWALVIIVCATVLLMFALGRWP